MTASYPTLISTQTTKFQVVSSGSSFLNQRRRQRKGSKEGPALCLLKTAKGKQDIMMKGLQFRAS